MFTSTKPVRIEIWIVRPLAFCDSPFTEFSLKTS